MKTRLICYKCQKKIDEDLLIVQGSGTTENIGFYHPDCYKTIAKYVDGQGLFGVFQIRDDGILDHRTMNVEMAIKSNKGICYDSGEGNP